MATAVRSIEVHPAVSDAAPSRSLSLARRFFSGSAKTELAVQLIARADEARDRHDWAAAANHYAAALEAGANVGFNVQLGHALKELEDYVGAEVAYRRFLDVRPNDGDINLQLGHLYNRQDDLVGALEWYERALQLTPADPDIIGHVHAARRRKTRATVERKRNQAMTLVNARAWHRARFLLNELVTVDGEEDLIGVFANVTKEAGDFLEAESLYQRYASFARQKAPERVADVELQLGHLHRAMGEEGEALKHYIRARRAHAEHSGDVAEDSPYDTVVHARIDDIYTCFWRP